MLRCTVDSGLAVKGRTLSGSCWAKRVLLRMNARMPIRIARTRLLSRRRANRVTLMFKRKNARQSGIGSEQTSFGSENDLLPTNSRSGLYTSVAVQSIVHANVITGSPCSSPPAELSTSSSPSRRVRVTLSSENSLNHDTSSASPAIMISTVCNRVGVSSSFSDPSRLRQCFFE